MSKIAVFPGSFDPFTIGHEAVILRAAPLFDKVIVAIGSNSTKNYLFTMEQREQWIREVFKDYNNIEVQSYEGLTIDFCKNIGAKYLLRGLRNTIDFEFEKSISQMNKAMNNNIETVFLLTDPEYSAINSSIVREIIKNDGDVSSFVPKVISDSL